jgi:hypothetical protein
MPWGVEGEHLNDVIADNRAWQRRQLWRGRITPYLAVAYVAVLAFYLIAGLAVLVWRP